MSDCFITEALASLHPPASLEESETDDDEGGDHARDVVVEEACRPLTLGAYKVTCLTAQLKEKDAEVISLLRAWRRGAVSWSHEARHHTEEIHRLQEQLHRTETNKRDLESKMTTLTQDVQRLEDVRKSQLKQLAESQAETTFLRRRLETVEADFEATQRALMPQHPSPRALDTGSTAVPPTRFRSRSPACHESHRSSSEDALQSTIRKLQEQLSLERELNQALQRETMARCPVKTQEAAISTDIIIEPLSIDATGSDAHDLGKCDVPPVDTLGACFTLKESTLSVGSASCPFCASATEETELLRQKCDGLESELLQERERISRIELVNLQLVDRLQCVESASLDSERRITDAFVRAARRRVHADLLRRLNRTTEASSPVARQPALRRRVVSHVLCEVLPNDCDSTCVAKHRSIGVQAVVLEKKGVGFPLHSRHLPSLDTTSSCRARSSSCVRTAPALRQTVFENFSYNLASSHREATKSHPTRYASRRVSLSPLRRLDMSYAERSGGQRGHTVLRRLSPDESTTQRVFIPRKSVTGSSSRVHLPLVSASRADRTALTATRTLPRRSLARDEGRCKDVRWQRGRHPFQLETQTAVFEVAQPRGRLAISSPIVATPVVPTSQRGSKPSVSHRGVAADTDTDEESTDNDDDTLPYLPSATARTFSRDLSGDVLSTVRSTTSSSWRRDRSRLQQHFSSDRTPAPHYAAKPAATKGLLTDALAALQDDPLEFLCEDLKHQYSERSWEDRSTAWRHFGGPKHRR